MNKTKPLISIIVAMADNRVIGKDNQMPWHLPADLAHFKKTTLGKPVIMGRNTYQSIGRPLPGRKNIVVTANPDFTADGMFIASDLEKAVAACGDVEEIIIMGGATIYQQMLPKTDRLYLTFIDLSVVGDTQFPDYNHRQWRESSREQHKADEKNAYDLTFVTLEALD